MLVVKGITGFSNEMLAKELWKLFENCGRIIDVILPKKKDKFGNRYGFVCFANHSDAFNSLRVLNGTLIGEKKLYLAPARERGRMTYYLTYSNHLSNGNFLSSTVKEKTPRIQDMFSPVKKNNCIKENNPFVPQHKINVEKVPNDCYSLKKNASFMKEPENSHLLETVNKENVDLVYFLVEGLGFKCNTRKNFRLFYILLNE